MQLCKVPKKFHFIDYYYCYSCCYYYYCYYYIIWYKTLRRVPNVRVIWRDGKNIISIRYVPVVPSVCARRPRIAVVITAGPRTRRRDRGTFEEVRRKLKLDRHFGRAVGKVARCSYGLKPYCWNRLRVLVGRQRFIVRKTTAHKSPSAMYTDPRTFPVEPHPNGTYDSLSQPHE